MARGGTGALGPGRKQCSGTRGVLEESRAWHWLLWGDLGAPGCCPLLLTGGKWSFLCLRCGGWILWKRWASEEGCSLEATFQERQGPGTGGGELRMTVPTVRLATLALWPMRGPDMLWTRELGVGRAGGGRERGGGELVGGLQEPPCYLQPLPPFEEVSWGPEPTLSPGSRARRKDLEGP